MKRRHSKKSQVSSPAEPATADELRAFALFLKPLYEQEWHSELLSDKPDWMYLALLHRRLREMEEEECR